MQSTACGSMGVDIIALSRPHCTSHSNMPSFQLQLLTFILIQVLYMLSTFFHSSIVTAPLGSKITISSTKLAATRDFSSIHSSLHGPFLTFLNLVLPRNYNIDIGLTQMPYSLTLGRNSSIQMLMYCWLEDREITIIRHLTWIAIKQRLSTSDNTKNHGSGVADEWGSFLKTSLNADQALSALCLSPYCAVPL